MTQTQSVLIYPAVAIQWQTDYDDDVNKRSTAKTGCQT